MYLRKISNKRGYNSAMERIDASMRRGEDMSDKDAAELRTLALSAQAFEKMLYEIALPKTFHGILFAKSNHEKVNSDMS